jgi:hypothetical protein
MLPPARGPSLVPAAQGIDVAPTGQEIGFGRHRAGAVAAVARVLGRAPDAAAGPPGCPLAAVDWPRDGLTLYFEGRDARFVGWRAGEGRTFPGEPRTAGRTC